MLVYRVFELAGWSPDGFNQLPEGQFLSFVERVVAGEFEAVFFIELAVGVGLKDQREQFLVVVGHAAVYQFTVHNGVLFHTSVIIKRLANPNTGG